MTGTTVRLLPGPSPVPAGSYDLGALGYVEQELVVEGEATSYRLLGERSPDGRWDTEPAEVAPFTTRLLVRRPSAPYPFSGTVVVEWLNVSGGADAGPDWTTLHTHLIRRGHAWVGVSAQKAGIDGGGIVEGMHLKRAFPDRYGILSHPGDAWSYDIFTQVGQLLAGDVEPAPLGPLQPTRLLAVGESQSAAFLVTYLNAIDVHAGVFDGFLVHSRGASGAGLEGFMTSATGTNMQGADVTSTVRADGRTAKRIRDDLRAPVVVLQTETDVALLGAGRAEQPDSDLLRQWEVAGAAHADTYLLVAGAEDDGHLAPERLASLLRPTDKVLRNRTGSPINSGPQQHYVALAALEHLDRWAGGGDPPPRAPRLQPTDDGAELRRDDLGNAIGGIRSPWVDVPTATLSGMGQTGAALAILFGTTTPFAPETLARLYPGGVDDYLGRFRDALDRTITEGFVLADDRDEILGLAAAAYSR